MREYNRIKPCPFCGNQEIEIRQGAQGITFVLCGDGVGTDGCGAIVSFRPTLTITDTFNAYNRREKEE